MSFALGVGFPLGSPSPLDALASGAAFLNPKFPAALPGDMTGRGVLHGPVTQNDGLAELSNAPHVVNVDFTTPSTVVDAAEASTRPENRFASYVPDALEEANVHLRVCKALTSTGAHPPE